VERHPILPGEQPFSPQPVDDEEQGVETSLRPACFAEFIGQERVVENLRIAVAAARQRGDTLDHILFTGMPGLGKTTLSRLIAAEMGVELRATSGPVLEHGRDLLGIITNLQRGDVLFIDEIHRMSREAEEYLYSAMEDFQVDLVVDRGPDARTYRIDLQPFTLVGATTRAGLLSAPFRSRFGIQEKLEPYDERTLAAIVQRSARILRSSMDRDAAEELARRSRGTPRFANRFLRRIRDVAQLRSGSAGGSVNIAGGSLHIDGAAVEEGLDRLGVDGNGLDRVDRMIVEILLANGDRPVGLKTLAVSVGEEERTLEDVYEPYLIQRGLLVKTPRGRLATARALELLGAR
jgi:Holliday junction DNA helicase RuvB